MNNIKDRLINPVINLIAAVAFISSNAAYASQYKAPTKTVAVIAHGSEGPQHMQELAVWLQRQGVEVQAVRFKGINDGAQLQQNERGYAVWSQQLAKAAQAACNRGKRVIFFCHSFGASACFNYLRDKNNSMPQYVVYLSAEFKTLDMVKPFVYFVENGSEQQKNQIYRFAHFGNHSSEFANFFSQQPQLARQTLMAALKLIAGNETDWKKLKRELNQTLYDEIDEALDATTQDPQSEASGKKWMEVGIAVNRFLQQQETATIIPTLMVLGEKELSANRDAANAMKQPHWQTMTIPNVDHSDVPLLLSKPYKPFIKKLKSIVLGPSKL